MRVIIFRYFNDLEKEESCIKAISILRQRSYDVVFVDHFFEIDHTYFENNDVVIFPQIHPRSARGNIIGHSNIQKYVDLRNSLYEMSRSGFLSLIIVCDYDNSGRPTAAWDLVPAGNFIEDSNNHYVIVFAVEQMTYRKVDVFVG